jgi:hypothetical protein
VAGATVIAEGAPGSSMYVIVKGTVESRGGDRLLSNAGPGDIAGEMALNDSHARRATAITRTGWYQWMSGALPAWYGRHRFSRYRYCARWPSDCGAWIARFDGCAGFLRLLSGLAEIQ